MKNKNKSLYIIGSIVLTVGSVIVIPKFIDFASSFIYEKQPRGTVKQDDEWGPEIVKKSEE